MMKKVWIIVRNDHLGYEEVEVVGETEKKFILSTVIKRCSHKSINKEDAFYREIDVINAIIAQSADQLSRINQTKKREPQTPFLINQYFRFYYLNLVLNFSFTSDSKPTSSQFS